MSTNNLSNTELDQLGQDIVNHAAASNTHSAPHSSTTDSPKDDALARLLAAVNFETTTPPGAKWGNLDPLYRHPDTGACVYCGNTNAAQSKKILSSCGITRVVNCKDPDSPNYHERDPTFAYLRFPIAYHYRDLPRKDTKSTLRYFARLHLWVDAQLADGHSVLIHCLAGAHRAGTASISYVMWAAKLSNVEAITLCQRQRPVINPIGSFPALLEKLNSALSTLGTR